MSVVKRPYTDDFLRGYSAEHVLYEIDMFFSAVEVLTMSSLEIVTHSPVIHFRVKNGMVEVFSIHLRNIIDFLYLDNPKSTDVVAADFCPSGKWQAERTAISTLLKTSRVRANKEIAHLTTSRKTGTPPDKNWDLRSNANEIASLLKKFATLALDSRLDSKVFARIEQCTS